MGAPGGFACKSSCNNLRNIFTSSIGTGSRNLRVTRTGLFGCSAAETSGIRPCAHGSNSNCSRNSCAASARAPSRVHTCSSMRFSRNASGNKEAKSFVDHYAAVAVAETKKNGVFVMPGIGRLVRVDRKARMGRNPATGEAIKIPAKKVVKFRVAKAVRDSIVPPKKK